LLYGVRLSGAGESRKRLRLPKEARMNDFDFTCSDLCAACYTASV